MLRHRRDRGSVIQRMRMSIVVGVAALSVAVGIGMVATPVFAATDCGGVETSIIGGDACDGASVNSNDSADSPVISVLTFVMKIMVGAVGVAAVGALIYAGILYSAAGGEAGQVQKAKTVIRDTVIGIVCFAGMIIILNFVIPGGVFGQTGTTGGGTADDGTSSGSDPIQTSNSTKFTIVSMPDTQFEITREAKHNEVKVLNDMKWIVNNKTKQNIQVVVGPGDIVNAGEPGNSKVEKMFATASKDYAILDNAKIPYSITNGNHDSDGTCTDPGSSYGARTCSSNKDKETTLLHQATMLNRTFTTNRAGLKGLTLYKAGQVQNSYRVFRVRNTNWLILSMEFYPRAAVVQWATKVISSHPSYNVVIVTHGYMGSGTSIINGGVDNYCASNGDCTSPHDIFNNILMKYSNVKLLFSGHVTYESTRVDTSKAGNKVVQYKSTAHECISANSGGSCLNPIRIVQIDLEKGTVTSNFCKTVTPTSISKCSTKTVTGMKYVTSGTSGASGGSGSGSVGLVGVENFRDTASLNSTILKPGLLYRSANLNNANSDDKTKLKSLLKGGAVIDLRQSTDKGYKKDPSLSGVQDIAIPIKGEATANGYKKTFVDDSTARSQFGKVITTIADLNGPALVHCTYGKDRTGWTVAMIMYIVGDGKYSADKLDTMVMNEYMLSKDVSANRIVDQSWLNAGLTEARAKYKSIMNYIRQGLGVSDDTITKLKNRLGV